MSKNKIFIYFAVSLGIFAVLTAVFYTLFSRNNLHFYQLEIERQLVIVTEILDELPDRNFAPQMGMGGGRRRMQQQHQQHMLQNHLRLIEGNIAEVIDSSRTLVIFSYSLIAAAVISIISAFFLALSYAAKENTKIENLRRNFIANISHELRTPVTVIRGSLEAIKDGVVTDQREIKEYNEQMLTETIYLQRLVSDLTDLANLQNPDFKIEIQKINLKDIMEDALRSMEKLAAPKNLSLNFIAGEGDYTYSGDYDRLRQMFIIVLDNAIKFSYEGEINGKIDIELSERVNIIASIRDYGKGIESDELNNIFERFHKQRSEQNKTGTGLGLAIAEEIALRHNISITAENSYPGTKFIFIFK